MNAWNARSEFSITIRRTEPPRRQEHKGLYATPHETPAIQLTFFLIVTELSRPRSQFLCETFSSLAILASWRFDFFAIEFALTCLHADELNGKDAKSTKGITQSRKDRPEETQRSWLGHPLAWLIARNSSPVFAFFAPLRETFYFPPCSSCLGGSFFFDCEFALTSLPAIGAFQQATRPFPAGS
jgi:hypothetical protein